jgi:hypothetical protein
LGNGKSLVIKAGDIPKYCNDAFYTALFYWDMVKRFGWPDGQGWGNEPSDFVETIYAIDLEHDKVQVEEQKKREEEAKRSRHTAKKGRSRKR